MNNHHEEELEEVWNSAIPHVSNDNNYEKELEEAGSSIPSTEQNSEVKKLRLWQIFALCSIGLAQDFILAVEAGYTVPLLVASGLPIQFTSFLWGAVGVLIIFLQPVNSISDSCTWSCGRRRPFIALFSISAAICIITVPNLLYVVSPHLIATITVFTCFSALDISVTMLQTMPQAYLMDVVPISQRLLAGFTYQMISGVGGLFGDLLGAIPWSSIAGKNVTIQNQAQVAFSIVALVTIVCMFLTIFSVKEKVVQPEELVESCSREQKGIKQHWCFRWMVEPYYNIIPFFYYMSVYMWLTFLYTITGTALYISYASYFTVFMGTVVYGGAQSCPVDSECYQNYVTGVRVGCLGLALAGATNILFSLSLNWITKCLKLKAIYLIVLTVFTIATAVMSIFHQLPVVLTLGMFFGPTYGLSKNIPFEMVPIYNSHDMLFRKQWSNQPEVVEGKAVAVLGTGFTLGSIVMAVVVSVVTNVVEDASALMLIPCGFAALTSVLVFCTNMPSPK